MKVKPKLTFPIVYGLISALIAFIAVFFIAHGNFRLSLPISIALAGISSILFYIFSYFRGHASSEIKRIVQEYHLTDQELAKMTGLKVSDFPIYHDRLQLILPKRYWPRILDILQKYEQEQKNKQ